MPAPKEKPKGRAPKEKRGGFTPKEARRIVQEKYHHMAEQRRPEENEREYAAEHLQSGLEKGSAFVGDSAGREKEALRKSMAHSGSRQEPTPPPESTPPSDTANPAATREPPGPEPAKRANAPKERSADTAPEMRPNLGRMKDEARHTRPKERSTDTVPEMRPNLGRIHAAKQDVKLELAKTRAGNHGRAEPEPASFPDANPAGGQNKNAPTAQAVTTHDTETIADAGKAFPRGKEKKSPPSSSAVKAPKAGRPAPGRSQPPSRDTARPRPIQAVRQRLKRQAVKRAAQQRPQGAASHTAKTVAHKGATVAIRGIQAAARAVAALFGAVAGLLGGGTLLVIILLVAMVGALVSSPFGILFSNQDHTPGVIPVSLAVGQINQAFSSHLDGLQSGGSYDSVEIHGEKAEWVEVLAVFAVKTALYDGENAADVVTLDQERVNRLSAVFWDMNPVRTEVEAIYHPPVDEEDSGWTEYILHIYIEGKTAEDMKLFYGFTPAQAEALDELLEERELLTWLLSDLSISDETARDVLERLPEELNPKRRAAVETALKLVGKVSYFWGGKSYVIGWDERWGQLTKVTSPGSSTTGSYLPFGLDCTGYLDWTFRNADLQSDGHWYLETNLTEISWADALPGDIVLFPDDSHVGLVVGRDAAGRVLVVHCSFSLNNVAISDGQTFGFTKIGRPSIYGDK